MVDSGITFTDYLGKAFVELPENFSPQKAILWVENCINNFHKHTPKQIYDLLAKLIITFNGSQEFNNAINNKIKKIINLCLLIYTDNDVASALTCLEVILVKYGMSSFVCKAKITEYLERFLCSSFDIQIISKAGNALHFLQQVGTAGKDGIVHKQQWLEYVQRLCKTMHMLYNAFLDKIREFDSNLYEIDAEPFNCAVQIQFNNKEIGQQLRNVALFLKCALVKRYPTTKCIPFSSIFYVIRRVLIVDEYSGSLAEMDGFLHVLYTTQINSLHLLKALVVCGTSGIRKYSEEILKLLVDCLKRTDKEYFTNKSMYQVALHSVLNEFIIVERENLSSAVCDRILSHNLKYILSVDKPIPGSNKIEEFTDVLQFLQLTPAHHQLSVTNAKCKEAIYTSINLLTKTVFTNEEKLDALYTFAENRLFNINNGYSEQPYQEFTTDLCKLLNALCTKSNYCSLPLLNCTIFMLHNNRSNKNEAVYECGLQAIENLVHPLYPSLTIAKPNDKSTGSSRNLLFENDIATRNINGFPFGNVPVVNDLQVHLNTNKEVHEVVLENHSSSVIVEAVVHHEPPLKKSRTDNIDDVPAKNSFNTDNFISTDTESEEIQLRYQEIANPELLIDGAVNFESVQSNEQHITNKLFEENLSLSSSTEQVSKNSLLETNAIMNCPEDKFSKKNLYSNDEEDMIKVSSDISDDEDMLVLSHFHDIPNEDFLNFE